MIVDISETEFNGAT